MRKTILDYKMYMSVVTVIAWAAFCVTGGHAQEGPPLGMSIGELSDILFKSYVRYIPPTSKPTVVNVECWVEHIHKVDILRGELVATIKLQLGWRDDNLLWDLGDVKGRVPMLILPLKSFWQPSVTIINSLSPWEKTHEDTVSLSNTGHVCYVQSYLIKTSCKTVLEQHDQMCDIAFRSWYRSYSDIDLVIGTESGIKDTYEETNQEWQVTNITMERRVDNVTESTPHVLIVASVSLEQNNLLASHKHNKVIETKPTESAKPRPTSARSILTTTSSSAAYFAHRITIVVCVFMLIGQ